MTYETLIGIEIAGIRRGLQLTIQYGVETVDGSKEPILDSISLRYERKQLPASWVLHVLGPRQLKELQAQLLRQWEATIAA